MKKKEWDLPLPLFLASSSRERRRGLIAKENIDFALVIPFCPLVHTWGMKEEIDILFLRANRIERIYHNVPRGKIRGAFALTCIEMPRGSAEKFALREGDSLFIR